MPTINAAVKKLDHNTVRFTYANLANTDDGAPIGEIYNDYADRTVQVKGTFGVGGNAKIEGSLDDGVAYAALNDPFGAALDITIAGIHAINEITPLTRPRISAGDVATDLTVIILCRRSRSAKEL